MDWVPVPNKHDGDGYTLLVDRPDGAAMLGAWLAILQVASKCDPRGTLLRDGATPHDAASISRITRLPKATIQTALEILENECKWLTTSTPAGGCGKPAGGCGTVTTEGKGREWNGSEMNGSVPPSESGFAETPSWEEFWAYCQTQACLLPSEWFARDKFEAAEAANWERNRNWKAYARRCKGWWEQDGRPMQPNKQKAGKPLPEQNQLQEVIEVKSL